MTTVLCTLYNSLYLDKGLVLYDSLCECAEDFRLYVLCMDDKCYEVLKDLNQDRHIPVRLADFEAGDDPLLKAKGTRSMGEYCWTCTSSFIRYVLKHYNEPVCTYIDADMYFYNDPQVLLDEMLEAGKSVMVVPHRFCKEKENQAATAGLFCVEFNTFMNKEESLEVLEYWRKRCLETVKQSDDGIHYGDQKYLEELVRNYDCVYVSKHEGAGIAPWNVYSYAPGTKENSLLYLPSNKQTDIVFYHYQSLVYLNRRLIEVSLRKHVNRALVEMYYLPYLLKLDKKKEILLTKYGVNTLIHAHPAKFSHFKWLKKYKIGQWLLYLRRKKDGMVIVRL